MIRIFLFRAAFLPLILFGAIGIRAGFEREWSTGLFDLGRGPAFSCWIMLLLLPALLLRDWKLYQFTNRVWSWLPSLLCLALFLTMHLQRERIAQREAEPALFSGWTQDIGTDGGSTIDFKASGTVQLNVVYRFGTDHFEGRYSRSGDTLLLDLPRAAPLGSRLLDSEGQLKALEVPVKITKEIIYGNR